MINIKFDVDREILARAIISKSLMPEEFANYLWDKYRDSYKLIKKRIASKNIDEEKYKWTYPYTEFWLLNTFKTEGYNNYIGSINCTTGVFEYQYNLKVYAGIRPCFYASTN